MKAQRLSSKLALYLVSLLLTFNFLFFAVYAISNRFTGFGFNEAVIYHVFYGIEGFDVSLYLHQIIGFLIFTALFVFAAFKYPRKYLSGFRFNGPLAIALATLLWFQPMTNNLATHFGLNLFKTDFFGDLDPVLLSDIEINNKRNLVVIYAESLESTFMHETLFPGLTPGLNRLAKRGLSFTDIRQTYGASSTIAGMVASQCAVPFDIHALSAPDTPFLPSLYCLGDVLAENGYTLSYIGGAFLDFAGKGNFYLSHGFDRVIGREILSARLPDPGYISEWGIYDDFLFEQAYRELITLAEKESPFALFMLTLDTHSPDLFPSAICANYRYAEMDDEYLDAIHCADHLLTRFVEGVRNSAAGENTNIVILSDHISANNKPFDNLKVERSQRSNLLLALGPDVAPGVNNRTGSTLDVMPTLLQLLGAATERVNLGVSLLADEPTLMETSPDIDEQLRGWSYQLKKFN